MLALRWNDRQGQLSISEELLKALSYPHQLVLLAEGETGLLLYQLGDERAGEAKARKVHYSERAMPRLSIGADPARELGLIPGLYQAWVEGNFIRAVWNRA